MDTPYLWPNTDATLRLNALLELPATGREQDWEVEMADADRLPEMLVLFHGDTLDLESRSALALLMLHTLDCPNATQVDAVSSIQEAIGSDPEVMRRMISYWSHHQPISPSVPWLLSAAT